MREATSHLRAARHRPTGMTEALARARTEAKRGARAAQRGARARHTAASVAGCEYAAMAHLGPQGRSELRSAESLWLWLEHAGVHRATHLGLILSRGPRAGPRLQSGLQGATRHVSRGNERARRRERKGWKKAWKPPRSKGGLDGKEGAAACAEARSKAPEADRARRITPATSRRSGASSSGRMCCRSSFPTREGACARPRRRRDFRPQAIGSSSSRSTLRSRRSGASEQACGLGGLAQKANTRESEPQNANPEPQNSNPAQPQNANPLRKANGAVS